MSDEMTTLEQRQAWVWHGQGYCSLQKLITGLVPATWMMLGTDYLGASSHWERYPGHIYSHLNNPWVTESAQEGKTGLD